jgi:hypothetical protein
MSPKAAFSRPEESRPAEVRASCEPNLELPQKLAQADGHHAEDRYLLVGPNQSLTQPKSPKGASSRPEESRPAEVRASCDIEPDALTEYCESRVQSAVAQQPAEVRASCESNVELERNLSQADGHPAEVE